MGAYRTVGEVAAKMYAGMVYDVALPQSFADTYPELVGNVVWGYPDNSFAGEPWPITAKGKLLLSHINAGKEQQ